MLGLVVNEVKGAARAYLAEKLRAAGVDESGIEAALQDQATSKQPPVLADPSTLAMTDEQAVEIRVRRKCALQTLRDEAPLADGESIVEDHFTVLAADWDELPEDTVILRRTTDRAVLFYIFADWRFAAGAGLVWGEPPAELLDPRHYESAVEAPERMTRGLATMGVIDLLLPLAKALGGAIAGKAGTFVLEAIFPPSPPDYFDEVYRQVAKVVNAELTQHDVDLISARLNALLDWQRRVYNPKNPRSVTDRHEREKLFDQVEAEIRQLDDAIAILRHPRWSKPGFTVFALAGSVYLALCQEASLMDYHDTDPRKSSYFKTIQLTAAEFATSLENTLSEILRLRRDIVRLDHGTQNLKISGTNYMFRTYHYHDPINGRRGKVHKMTKKDNKTVVGDPFGDATRDMDNYRSQLPSILESELGMPTKVIAGWRALVSKPLPV